MHYSIQQDLARARHDNYLREATSARLVRPGEDRETRKPRLRALRALALRREPQRRPLPAS